VLLYINVGILLLVSEGSSLAMYVLCLVDHNSAVSVEVCYGLPYKMPSSSQ